MVASGNRRRARRFLLPGALLALALIAGAGVRNLNGVILRMAEARASQLAVEAVNRAVAEVMGDPVSCAELMQASFDEAGRLSMLTSNTLRMNSIASAVALAAQRRLGELAETGVSIPLGSALGVNLFSGSGPMVRARVIPVGSVTTGFSTAFESAGINQTRHEVSLCARVTMRIVIPTGAHSVTVDALVPIAESIIVGQVPESYVNVPGVDSALNLIP